MDQGGRNIAVEDYVVIPGFPPIDKNVRYLGQLHGSWREIGIQYGEKAGDLIRWVFDAWWITAEELIKTLGKDHIIEDLHRYETSVSFLSLGLLDFMKGIAEGASQWLSKSAFAEQCTDYEKILLINTCTSLIWNHPPLFRHGKETSPRSSGIYNGNLPTQTSPHQGAGCSNFAVIGDLGGAKNGKVLHAHSRDTEFCPWNYNVFFISQPNETGTKTWWTLAMAGQLSGNMAGNICGVSIGSSAGASPPIGETPLNERAFGVPISCFRAYAAAYASSAAEAASFFASGTDGYRKRADRSTLLRDFGNNELFVDQDECLVVEATACRYGVRKPRENGENGNYIVVTNHQYCSESYDENNEKTHIPMTSFGSELSEPFSATRFWTLMWLIKNHFGIIDESLIKSKFMTCHFFFDKTGGRQDSYCLDPYGEIPAHNAGATICRHNPGFPEPFLGGSNDVKVFSLRDMEVYWIQGRPCEWHGDWNHINLKQAADQV